MKRGWFTIGSNRLFSWIAPIYNGLTWHRSVEDLVDLLELDEDCLLLDVGGGTGQLVAQLSREVRGRRAIVLDLNQAMLSQGESLSHDRVRGNGKHLPFGDGSVDRIVLTDALHHMARAAEVLAEARRVLGDEGIVVIEEFNPTTWLGWILYLVEIGLGMGSQFRSPADLNRLADRAGLSVKEVRERGFVYYASLRPSPE